ncbi:hypothetical protein LB505_000666 [Fusarium chuoi]|nr:hypothetical protein LB505_000666 [Fusarium chuoi]
MSTSIDHPIYLVLEAGKSSSKMNRGTLLQNIRADLDDMRRTPLKVLKMAMAGTKQCIQPPQLISMV